MNLIDLEKRVHLLMFDSLHSGKCLYVHEPCDCEAETSWRLDVWKKRRNIQFTIGVVRFTHTLMYDLEGARYPFKEWLRLLMLVCFLIRSIKFERLSPYNCVKRMSHFTPLCQQCLWPLNNIEKRDKMTRLQFNLDFDVLNLRKTVSSVFISFLSSDSPRKTSLT